MSVDYSPEIEEALALEGRDGRHTGLMIASTHVLDLAQKAWAARKEEADMLRRLAEDLEVLAKEERELT